MAPYFFFSPSRLQTACTRGGGRGEPREDNKVASKAHADGGVKRGEWQVG